MVEGCLTEHFSLTPYFCFVLFSGYEQRDLAAEMGSRLVVGYYFSVTLISALAQ
jgi:hypothetical protein